MKNSIGENAVVTFDLHDANTASVNIQAPSREEINAINSFIYTGLSYFNDKLRYSWEYDQGFTDAMEYIYDRTTQTLPIGLLPRVKDYITKSKPHIKIKVSNSIRSLYTAPIANIDSNYVKSFAESLGLYNQIEKTSVIPYEHQIRLVDRALNGRRISLLACTSAGKSLSMCILARYLVQEEKKKVLIITPSSALVEQLYSDFYNDYGWTDAAKYCTLIHGESRDKLTNSQKQKLQDLNLGEEVMLKDITISTWQSLQNKPLDFFRVFTAVIVDEAHGTRGEVLRSILDKCVNAGSFKIGLSGTLPDDGLDAAWIEGALGRKQIIVRLKELIDLGILTPVEVHSIRIPYREDVRKYVCRQNYKSEYSLLTNNGSRKKVMELLIDSGQIDTTQNTVILYKTKSTLDEMHEFLAEKYPQFKYHIVKGEVSASERDAMRSVIENSSGNIIIATYGTMKQGVNIKFLHNLIFAEFSKSMYEVVQSIGRIVRKHKLKKLARVIDIFDDCSYYTSPRNGGYPKLMQNYSCKHYAERNKYYADDQIPVIELDLTGIYEATIDTDSIKSKKETAKQIAVSKSRGKKKSARPIRKKSQFLD